MLRGAGEVGLLDDKSDIDVRQIKNQLTQMEQRIPTYQQSFKKLTIDNMRKELADEALEKKWKELNMGID